MPDIVNLSKPPNFQHATATARRDLTLKRENTSRARPFNSYLPSPRPPPPGVPSLRPRPTIYRVSNQLQAGGGVRGSKHEIGFREMGQNQSADRLFFFCLFFFFFFFLFSGFASLLPGPGFLLFPFFFCSGSHPLPWSIPPLPLPRWAGQECTKTLPHWKLLPPTKKGFALAREEAKRERKGRGEEQWSTG